MLVLSRKIGDAIQIDSELRVEILEIRGSRVRIGITGPKSISIRRSELSPKPRQETKTPRTELAMCCQGVD